MPTELIIRTQQSDGSFHCERYLNFPGRQSAYVIICFVDTNEAEEQAISLKEHFLDTLRALDFAFQQDSPICKSQSYALFDCPFNKNAQYNRLMVVVSDGNSVSFKNEDVLLWNETVLPVFPRNKHHSLPKPLDTPNASFWDLSITDTTPVVLSLTGVSDEEFRVFISYRRSDTSMLAEQLHDELVHIGFEVFLDRFSIKASINFQERLYQELADKAMVILLESKNYLESEWVKYEINFAKKYKLGVLALHPEKQYGDVEDIPTVSGVDEEFRFELENIDFTSDKKLLPTKLTEVLTFIKEKHAKIIYRRRHYLQENIMQGLVAEKATPHIDAHGFINVSDAENTKCYKIWPVIRPPMIKDFHFSDTRCSKEQKIIIGPEFMESKRKLQNEWLSNKTAIQFYSEPQILSLCQYVAKGTI